MPKPSDEALKRAWEIIERNVPRHELAPHLALVLQEFMDEHHSWVRRVDDAEFEAKEAKKHAKACEVVAQEWKARADQAERLLEGQRSVLFAAGQAHGEAIIRAEEVEARLAELVRRLWQALHCPDDDDLRAKVALLADEYDGGERG